MCVQIYVGEHVSEEAARMGVQYICVCVIMCVECEGCIVCICGCGGVCDYRICSIKRRSLIVATPSDVLKEIVAALY